MSKELEWRFSRSGNTYVKVGTLLATVLPNRRDGGFSVCTSNTEDIKKRRYRNEYETEDQARHYVEDHLDELAEEMGATL
jgi:hypothetical protein